MGKGLGMAVLIAALGLMGCASAAGPYVTLNGQRFDVEVADDQAERSRGLMFRDALGPGRGMLFIHAEETPQAYWMKNTKIALDILYFDAARRLVSIQRNVPPCSAGDRCPPYPSEGPALYVLELDAGTTDKLGTRPGDELTLSDDIKDVKGQP